MNKDLYKSYYKKIIEDTIKACKKQASSRSNSGGHIASSTSPSDETAYTRDSYQENISLNLPADLIKKGDPVEATALPGETSYGTIGSTSGGNIANNTLPVSGQSDAGCFTGNDGAINIPATGDNTLHSYFMDNDNNRVSSSGNPYTYAGLQTNQAYGMKVKDNKGSLPK